MNKNQMLPSSNNLTYLADYKQKKAKIMPSHEEYERLKAEDSAYYYQSQAFFLCAEFIRDEVERLEWFEPTIPQLFEGALTSLYEIAQQYSGNLTASTYSPRLVQKMLKIPLYRQESDIKTEEFIDATPVSPDEDERVRGGNRKKIRINATERLYIELFKRIYHLNTDAEVLMHALNVKASIIRARHEGFTPFTCKKQLTSNISITQLSSPGL